MSLQPLLDAPLATQLHVACAISAFLLGSVVVFKQKGGAVHRILGRIWVLLMLGVSVTSFFISDLEVIGPFSPIHLLSVYTIFGLVMGVRAAKQRRLAVHRGFMVSTYVGALIIAGAFTLMPGRRMHEVVFGPDAGLAPSLAVVVLAFVASALIMRRMVRSPREKGNRARVFA
ncbi:DUF2306 domain-containing protein [Tianweitania sediminis]|uniref:DUF2306 domain-containing protein n=1 Tax=Tianweitania sediminis TaxID=1502156 RepID=A0A8J7RI36_9HYPH|nr:DUF2306 domain-containing protein [Tianweitania sediminis]MBP0438821.1 DUF2306 domain-containing protein [Tianweitania sediminis]